MDGADFARKFRLIQRAAERAGRKLVDKKIAGEIFPTARTNDGGEKASNVEKASWSQRKRGRRHFNDEWIEPLFQAVHRQTPGCWTA